MKKLICILLTAAVLMSMTACTPEPPTAPSTVPAEAEGLPDAPEGAVLERDGKSILATQAYELAFTKEGDTYRVDVLSKADGAVMFTQSAMAAIRVRGKGRGIGIQTYSEETFAKGYDAVSKQSYGWLLEATVQTEAGSKFKVEDAYYVTKANVFGMERTVEVLEVSDKDVGFASIVSLINRDGSDRYQDFEYFIPAILYKDAKNVVDGAIASNLDLDYLYVKETRTGLPMVMVQNSASGYGLALMHLEPQISVGDNVGGGDKGEVNDELQYGAVGLQIEGGVAANFIYPCTEGPNTYDSGQGNVGRYHTVSAGNTHTYRVGFVPASEDCYTDAMTYTYMQAFEAEKRYIADISMDTVYAQNIEIFTNEYREYTFRKDVVAAGLPWSLSLPDGKAEQGYSFQMGFVGQQIPAAYQLLRYGLDNNDKKAVEQGTNMLNMWASPKIQSTYFPAVWFDPQKSADGGSVRNYPSFLRCMVDGMEGMLDAVRIAQAYNVDCKLWKDALMKFAYNLLAVQEPDGSFRRAYRRDGSVETDAADHRFQGASKLNTPIAIRFLAKMYEYTGDEAFKTAALNAAQYSYDELYVKLGKYVGGTPDNPNTVDKEAAMYAQYGFDAAYQLSGDEKYLDAAKHAAVSVMSWTYVYDFAVPSGSDELAKANPFADGGVIGFSLIATGHSGADNCSAFSFYEMYKLYVLTGEEFFLNAALLLENDTKLSTDYDGKLGYKYNAMMPEATNVSEFSFASVGTWLPWSGIANIDPIVHLQETFGQMDISSLPENLEILTDALDAYGIGGKPLKRS